MPKYRRPLNDKQLVILKIIYKFRFITVDLVVKSGQRYDPDVMRTRLKTLLDQGYIFRLFSSSDIRKNKSASYCLAPEGIRTLSEREGLNPLVLHASYRDRTASKDFIEHCLHIFRLYRKFEQLYPGRFSILTKSETAGHDYYPKKKPDIHLSDETKGSDYFLDFIEEDSKLVAIRQKIIDYSEHCEEEVWEQKTGDAYPQILLVCATQSVERRLKIRIPRWLNNEILTVYTVSYQTLIGSKSANDAIWNNVEEPEAQTQILHEKSILASSIN